MSRDNLKKAFLYMVSALAIYLSGGVTAYKNNNLINRLLNPNYQLAELSQEERMERSIGNLFDLPRPDFNPCNRDNSEIEKTQASFYDQIEVLRNTSLVEGKVYPTFTNESLISGESLETMKGYAAIYHFGDKGKFYLDYYDYTDPNKDDAIILFDSRKTDTYNPVIRIPLTGEIKRDLESILGPNIREKRILSLEQGKKEDLYDHILPSEDELDELGRELRKLVLAYDLI